MKKLNDLLAMCEQSGDCIIWHGATTKDGAPKQASRNLRREVYVRGGAKLQDNEHVQTTCGESGCLCRAHMVVKTRSQINAEVAKRPAVHLRRVAAAKRSARQTSAKLDEAKAAYIRDTDKAASVVAAELGISQQLASMVRNGLRWKPQNHFAVLMC